MDSDALETFLCVHRTGSVSAAALKLSRTQSAISRRLAVLEGQVGVPLFERVGRRLVTSDAGRSLLVHAERVAAALEDARGAMAQVRTGRAGTLRIAVVGTLADERLSASIRAVRERFPALDLHLRTATSAEVSDLVRAGEVALGLRYFTERSPGLKMQVVLNERLVVACAPSHPRAGRRVARLGSLAAERWLAFPAPAGRGELFARSIFGQFLARGVADLDWIAIDSLTAQKRLVEAELGIALLQESAIAEERERGRLATIAVGDLLVEVPVVSVTRPGSRLGDAGQVLIDALRGSGGQGLTRS